MIAFHVSLGIGDPNKRSIHDATQPNHEYLMFANSKQHFPTLDALRGVAAVVVVTFHVFETYSGGDQVIPPGSS